MFIVSDITCNDSNNLNQLLYILASILVIYKNSVKENQIGLSRNFIAQLA